MTLRQRDKRRSLGDGAWRVHVPTPARFKGLHYAVRSSIVGTRPVTDADGEDCLEAITELVSRKAYYGRLRIPMWFAVRIQSRRARRSA